MLESALPSPCYLMDQAKLKSNLMMLDELRRRTCTEGVFVLSVLFYDGTLS